VTEQLARLQDALSDRYRLERELGAGGMATVYLAHDLKHDRDVALKVLRPELGAVLGAERFLREIRLTARLQHLHILPLLDSGEAAGLFFYVMPYVEGESLRGKLSREKQLSLEEALRLTTEVAEALEYAHQQKIIHRDIKPENILLSRGHALVADFGIALAVSQAGGGRLTETGLSLGTPAYMSPEQAMAESDLDGRSDQYSLACVLYEMLAGEPPYTGTTAQVIIAKRLREPVPHLGTIRQVPPAVEEAVSRALAKAKADRFGSTAEFAAALAGADARAHRGMGARRGPPTRIGWRVAAALLAVAVVGFGAWLVMRGRGNHPAAFVPDLVQLTTDGNARTPSLSPDGRWLAYVARDCDEQERCVARLTVQDTGRAGVSTLLRSPSIEGVAWASAGRFLVVSLRDPPGIYAVPALGGAPRLLASAGGLTWATVVGTSDTVMVSPVFGAPGDSAVWLRFVTVSDGVVRDSLAVPLARDEVMFAYPAPRGGRVAILSGGAYGDTSIVRVLDRTGRVLGSTVRRGEITYHTFWAPQADALIWQEDQGNDQRVILRRRVAAGGGLTGPTDTLMRMAKGSDFAGFTADGAALLQQGPVEQVVYALERSAPGRLDFRVRRLISSTTPLAASLSSDGARVWLRRGARLIPGATPRYSIVPFEGGEERPFNLPPGELVSHNMTRPVSASLLALMRDSSRHLRAYQVTLATGQTRDLGPVADSTDDILAIPGGGWLEVRHATGTVQVRARPGRADTTWVFPPEPDRTVLWLLGVSSDAREFRTASWSSRYDTAWVRLVPLDGRPARPPVHVPTPGGMMWRWGFFDDGSVEYLLQEKGTTTGWYRVPPGGTRAVRLGEAPLQGDVAWRFSLNINRFAAVKSVDKPDVYLIRNFAQLLR